jgi:hypothetical protein
MRRGAKAVSGVIVCSILVALAVGMPTGAGAFALTQCEGSDITGEGGGLQLEAELTWTPNFNVSPNPDACNGTQGSLGTPAVNYVATKGSVALKAWSSNEEYGAFPFITKGFAPSTATIKKLENAAKFPARANTLLTIPVAQTAIAIIVHLPSGCKATSTPASGRLVLTNATLEALLRGTATTWSAIADSGDSVSGGSCNPATHITRVVPKEPSDPEGIVKKYLFLIDNAKVFAGTKTWQQISEATKWPEEGADPVSKQANVAEYVAGHASTLGIAWVHAARPLFGEPGHGAGSASFWVEVQDGTNSSSEPIYADPANNGDVEANGNSNCREQSYGNSGKPFPKKLTESWNTVSSEPVEPHYTLCGLTYLFAFNHYSAYSGATLPPTEADARTVHDYARFVVNIEASGGQPIIGAFGTDYSKLPPEIFNIARPEVGTVDY